jgi:hypothetical protein
MGGFTARELSECDALRKEFSLPESVHSYHLRRLKSRRYARVMISRSICLIVLCVAPTITISAAASDLRGALLFHASFDNRLDADVAAGDPKLYTAPTGNRSQAVPGLPASNVVLHTKGRFGDALHFTTKMRPVVFFKGEKNLGYTSNGWSGAASFWLQLNPDKDLQPGYCDPLQFVAQAWDEGNMFVEFSKDHAPRHFRYAMQPQKKSWNPQNRGWEDFAEKDRPMVAVHQPPFASEKWTHVVFCFANVNSGKKDGWGRLYLDGKDQGAFENWQLVFNWDETKSALTVGLSYIGGFDDLAVFNRPLTGAEVQQLHALTNGIRELK